jgi:hypothetical protein
VFDLKQISSISFIMLAPIVAPLVCVAETAKDAKAPAAQKVQTAAKSQASTTAPAQVSTAGGKGAKSASPDSGLKSNPANSAKGDKAEAGSKVAKDDKSTKPAVAKSKSRSSSISRSSFVPPPPPVVPTLTGPGMVPTVVLGGELIEYMSGPDLKELQSKTSRDLSKARNNLTAQNELLAEKQKRALSFDSLYAEGVVSRRELQNCKKEAADAESELEDAKLLVQELERKNDRIEARVKALSKTKMAGKKAPKNTP